MTVGPELAIVIPAWKPDYLREALASVAAQSDARFVCRIYDDAAPESVAQICKEFAAFDYVRFEDNLGGRDLVAHWNRCLAMVQEPWVWFFSDDDVMAPNAVAAFYAARAMDERYAVFQTAVDMVSDDLSRVLWTSSPPLHETARQFLGQRFAQRRLSCLPDHVFHRPTLLKLNKGFVELPLAWNADDATWALLGAEHGIGGIPSSKILWRQSGRNISGDMSSRWIKLRADLQYLDWLEDRSLIDQRSRVVLRWLGTRICRVYKMGLADIAPLGRILPSHRKAALAWALAVMARDIFR